MRLKPGRRSSPRGDDDEDISADVAENGVLAMEPDVPDTRKMLIRVRRKAVDGRARGPLRRVGRPAEAWNRTHRDIAMPGQVLVLHVPVGRAVRRPSRAWSGSRRRRPVRTSSARALLVGGSRGQRRQACRAKPAAHAAKAAPAKAAPKAAAHKGKKK
jgi:membrane-bound lytic murein transglycosylase D